MPIPPPILITGHARSGTSMIAGALARLGVFVGDTVTTSESIQPDGQIYENVFWREQWIKPYLRSIGCDPYGQHNFPLPFNLVPPVPHLRELAASVLESQGWPGGSWLVKDPKLTLVWPLWHAAFPNAMWIICKRDRTSVIASCRAIRIGPKTDWDAWYDAYTSRLEALSNTVTITNCFTIEPQFIAAGQRTPLHTLCNTYLQLDPQWTNAGWPAVEQSIHPDWWHFKEPNNAQNA